MWSESPGADAPFELTLLCPVCRDVLARGASHWRCGSGHAFDVAREGYANLLVRARRRSAAAGDTRPMLQARRRFLARGLYDPLIDHLVTLVRRQPAVRTVLEVGCGEGSYIGRIAARLPFLTAAAFDLSKDACRLTARRYPGVLVWTADSRRPWLLPDDQIDVLLNIFAPRHPAEAWRVLSPGGLFLCVLPEARHLAEARARYPMLGIEADKRAKVLAQFEAWELVSAESLALPLDLDAAAVHDLLMMTPGAWHWPDLAGLDVSPLRTIAAFIVLAFRRPSNLL